MTQTLYKGKCKHGEEWVEGFLFQTQEHTYIAYAEQFDDDLFLSPKNIFIEVIPETVGRYTGKDICGQELFEGDIVETIADYDDTFGYPATSYFHSVVIWDEKNFCWAFKTDEYIQAFNDWTWYNTVKVGNIHDNPELLQRGDK